MAGEAESGRKQVLDEEVAIGGGVNVESTPAFRTALRTEHDRIHKVVSLLTYPDDVDLPALSLGLFGLTGLVDPGSFPLHS